MCNSVQLLNAKMNKVSLNEILHIVFPFFCISEDK